MHLPGKDGVKDYHAVAWRAALFILPAALRDVLRERQLWEDVQQTVALAAFVAAQQGLDIKETSRLVQKEVYQALRDMGFRNARGGRWEWWEVGMDEWKEEMGDVGLDDLGERGEVSVVIDEGYDIEEV